MDTLNKKLVKVNHMGNKGGSKGTSLFFIILLFLVTTQIIVNCKTIQSGPCELLRTVPILSDLYYYISYL